MHVHPHVPFRCPRKLAAAALAVAVMSAIGCSSAVTLQATTGSPAQAAAAQPETEAGVRAAATQFYALYSAGQWAQAWTFLAPASQQAVPEALYAAVLRGCPSRAAGMARVIKSVVMAGSTAVVTETVAGALGALGSVTDAWSYSAGRWGYELTADVTANYSHGSAAADVAAFKAAGYCAGTPAALPTLPTVAPVTVPPAPSLAPLTPLPTAAAS